MGKAGSRSSRAEHAVRVYRKTETGLKEMRTRAHRLGHWMRFALVMVNGRRSEEELSTLIGASGPDTLRELLELGLIEPVTMLTEPPTTIQGDTPPFLFLPMALAQARALVWIAEEFGSKGAPLTRRVMRAQTPDELHHALVLTERYLRRAQGRERAHAFQRDVGLRPTEQH